MSERRYYHPDLDNTDDDDDDDALSLLLELREDFREVLRRLDALEKERGR